MLDGETVHNMPTGEWIEFAPVEDVAEFVMVIAHPNTIILGPARATIDRFLAMAAVRLAREVHHAAQPA